MGHSETTPQPSHILSEISMKRTGQRLIEKKQAFVSGLSEGKTPLPSAVDAGYSESTAKKAAHEILRRPLVQSASTDALMRCGITLDAIIRPLVDELQAKWRVLTENGPIEMNFPDHKIRGEYLNRAVPREVEIPAPVRPPPIINIQQYPPESSEKPNTRSGPDASGPSQQPPFRVTFHVKE